MKGAVRIIIIFIIFLLLAVNLFWGWQYFRTKEQLQKYLQSPRLNNPVFNFAKFFIDKVLGEEGGEVGFEDRLKLETAVRELKDNEILGLWQEFIASQTEEEVQKSLRRLLQTLINKIAY